ncbi:MAG: orotidine 5'-phosphate decarboxylase [Desulfurococcales archaeon]|nr:orotidine 5'-phosphate decarboxylase [Desulfurococcales archaeon]MCE4605280.1 orotidine 5'-phosphate decarboxylase [Desulfurococcales archaeon]
MTLIVAVDRPLETGTIHDICGEADGIKVGLPSLVTLGAKWMLEAAKACRGLKVLDLKLADIGPIMVETVKPFLGTYDVFIAHSFVGRKGALEDLKDTVENEGGKLVLVATMSHPGAREVYDPSLDWILGVIDKVDPWGLVAPATRIHAIEMLKNRYPGKVILSPGVGAQGAKPGEALCAGASYEIVGRRVTNSRDPVDEVRKVRVEQDERLSACRA